MKFEQFLFLTQRKKINEAASIDESKIAEYTPETLKEIEKILSPLIKKYNMEVRRIRPSVFGEPVPDIDVIVYSVIGGNWTHAQCFNQKDANDIAKLLQKVDVQLVGKDNIKIEKDTMGKTLFFGDYIKLAKLNGINIDAEKLKQIAIAGVAV